MIGTDRTIRVVCHFDPALDMTDQERIDYARDRKPIESLRLVHGMQPTVYYVRPLTRAMVRHCDAAPDQTDRAMRAFMAGVSKITHLLEENESNLEQSNITPVLEPAYSVQSGQTKTKIWSEEELERIPHWALIEIGGVAYAHSCFPPGIARRYPLLRSSPLVTEAVERLHAEKTLRDARQSREQPRTETPKREPSGDEPTGATATASATSA